MDKQDAEFLYDFSGLSIQQIERLEQIVYELTGDTINVKASMKQIWEDVTKPSKNGEKQKDWKEMGSDQIIEQWANDLENDIYNAVGDVLIDDEYSYNLVEEASDILNTLRDW